MVDNGREALCLPVLINGLPALPFFCRHMRLEAQSGVGRIIRKGSVNDYFFGSKPPSGGVYVTPVSASEIYNRRNTGCIRICHINWRKNNTFG